MLPFQLALPELQEDVSNPKGCSSPSWLGWRLSQALGTQEAPVQALTNISLTSTYTYLHNFICTTLQITSESGPQFSSPLK